MWLNCKDKLPNRDGTYFIVHRFNTHNVYGAAEFRKNLGKAIGLSEHEGESGFYEHEPEWGSFVTYPTAWKYIEKYRGDVNGEV